MPRIVLPIIVLAVLLLGGAWLVTRPGTPQSSPSPTSDLEAGGTASPLPRRESLRAAPTLQRPQFQSDGSLGSTVDLASFRGKQAVLVNFWATWCPPCEKELPDFVQLQAEFPDIIILAVNRGEAHDSQVAYLRDRNLLTTPIRFLDDADDQAYGAFGGFGMPVTAFVTKEGKIAFVKSGLMTLEEMRERTRQLQAAP